MVDRIRTQNIITHNAFDRYLDAHLLFSQSSSVVLGEVDKVKKEMEKWQSGKKVIQNRTGLSFLPTVILPYSI
jgi:hypothetical protein